MNEVPVDESVKVAGRKGEAALDWWSWVHVVSGGALAFLVGSWWIALLLLVGYEGAEGVLRHIKLEDGGLFEYESWPNVVADVVVGFIGFLACHPIGSRFAPW